MNEHHPSVDQLVEAKLTLEGPLLPVLHAIQDKYGYIPEEVVPSVARKLNLSRAEVHGVITYYHHFRTSPTGKHVLQICMAESCQACGSTELVDAAKKMLGCDMHQTSADGNVTLEPVYCLGLCANSPAIQIDERLHGRVDAVQLKSFIENLKV